MSPLEILSIAGGAVAFGVVLLPVIAWLRRESALPIEAPPPDESAQEERRDG